MGWIQRHYEMGTLRLYIRFWMIYSKAFTGGYTYLEQGAEDVLLSKSSDVGGVRIRGSVVGIIKTCNNQSNCSRLPMAFPNGFNVSPYWPPW
jgi:hypothetical protein